MRQIGYKRHLRLRFAPTGSRRDQWLKSIQETWSQVRITSLLNLLMKILPGFISQPLREANHKKKLASAAQLQERLQEILNQHANIQQVIIFPPSLDWNTQLFQRPQQLALALARQGALVFYIQPQIHNDVVPFQEISDRMVLCNVPLETFWNLKKPTIYILTWNCKYISAFQEPEVIYDYVDEIETFAGNHTQMYRDHERLIRTARLVTTTAERLYKQVLPLREDAILCPNGVNYEHFAPQFLPANCPPPSDLRPILDEGKAIVGYYGALAKWFDYALLTKVAKSRPDISFLLIGPDYDGSLPPSLIDLPNVYWLGVKSYADLPAYLHYFEVAMIPFLVNKITHATSPLKLFEYMAAGKPTIITPMEESARYPGILIASDAHEFLEKIDLALLLKNDPHYIQQITTLARENTWAVRARQILDALSYNSKGIMNP